MRGGRSGHVKGAMGRHLDRNGILATPDCRGGVFAVFAKISPPSAHQRLARVRL